MSPFLSRFFKPIDIMPLVFFRVVFGGIILWEVWRYFHYDRIFRYYIEPDFHFTYWGFGWVQPLPGDGMIWLFHFIGLLSVFILIGFFYRPAMTAFFFIFTYVFLLDETQYLNHLYLVCLISFLLIFVPAHRKWSVDAWLRPALRSESAPQWALWILRGQMAVVYIYGAIAKMNSDWLRGEPLREWLGDRTDFPLIGHLFTEEWMIYAFSYGGLLFDLLIVPLILWRRTRLLALVLALGFHLTNYQLFDIGIFPWFSIAITMIFLPPHWFRLGRKIAMPQIQSLRLAPAQRLLLFVLGIFFFVQFVMPLRQFIYPGYASWTEEGHNLSWRMKLRDKAGVAYFFATNPQDGMTQMISLENYLGQRQIGKMEDRPPMMLRFAHYLSSLPEYEGYEIRVWAMSSLNNRSPQLLVDPTANLAAQPDDLRSSDWIVPLVQPPSGEPRSPALLISRRLDGALVFINMTEIPFLLVDIELQAGDIVLSGEDLGMVYLAEDECAVATVPQAATADLFPICNERGRYSLSAEQAILQEQDFLVRFRGEQLTCTGLLCVVYDPVPGN
ncbi:MAG: HTTM domain-containing protein [Anaerolineae bacterium]|nr:HTTM domain-containing protein [Anaerolineae bacterium]